MNKQTTTVCAIFDRRDPRKKGQQMTSSSCERSKRGNVRREFTELRPGRLPTLLFHTNISARSDMSTEDFLLLDLQFH